MNLGKVHAVASCTVCGKEWTNYHTATDLAAKHARDTGHYVTGEVAYAMAWGSQRAARAAERKGPK